MIFAEPSSSLRLSLPSFSQKSWNLLTLLCHILPKTAPVSGAKWWEDTHRKKINRGLLQPLGSKEECSSHSPPRGLWSSIWKNGEKKKMGTSFHSFWVLRDAFLFLKPDIEGFSLALSVHANDLFWVLDYLSLSWGILDKKKVILRWHRRRRYLKRNVWALHCLSGL